MKKPTKREQFNLAISAFLVLGFGVCAYFFSSISGNSLANNLLGSIVYILIFLLFGLILFYATRVGDGKQVKRFNVWSLLLVVLPSLYVVLAYLLDFLPLHDQIAANSATAAIIAAVAMGYGIPYSFLSGYEIKEESEIEEETEEEADDSGEVDYSKLQTLDIATDLDETENETAETEQTDSEETAAPNDTELSDDTEKTIQSILDESTDK